MKRKRVTSISLHMARIGKKGGHALKKKMGKDYYSELANKRWRKVKAAKAAELENGT